MSGERYLTDDGLSMLRRMDAACDGFEACWKAGQRPRIEEYLGTTAGLEREHLLRELLSLELEYRLQRGEAAILSEYLLRFPESAKLIEAVFLQELSPRLSPAGGGGRGMVVRGQAEGTCGPTQIAPFGSPPKFGRTPRPEPDFLGTERFRVLRRIGAGGMGVVYEVEDQERSSRVALKTLFHLDAEALYRLKREFRALADVTHPNLAALHELFSIGDQWFFTLEFVDGVNFLEYVRGQSRPQLTDAIPVVEAQFGPSSQTTMNYTTPTSPLATEQEAGIPPQSQPLRSPEQFQRLRAGLCQLAEGIDCLHAAGMLHRDIKPSNVLVTAEGRVVLLDFGLVAKLEQQPLDQETEHEFAGTYAYMAPEQGTDQPLKAASDWYCVGVMLFEALTGRRPFLGTLSQVLREKREKEAPSPAELVPGIPDDLRALCVELLQRRPEDRPLGQEILRRLGRGGARLTISPAARTFPRVRPPFVGREQHLAALDDAYRAIRQGQPVTVFVHGRSGVGKSLLVQRFLESLVERGEVVILAGRCYERESVAYKAVDSLVDSLSRYLRNAYWQGESVFLPRGWAALARVFPVLNWIEAVSEVPGRATEIPDLQELRRRAFAALRELLARLGKRKPLVLAIDDLQWGDVDSAVLLEDLLRPPDAPVLLLLVCYRSEYAATSPCLQALLQAEASFAYRSSQESAGLDRRELTIEPLDLPEARKLALELLGPYDPAATIRAETIAQESGGIPYFIHELVQYFQEGAESAAPRCEPEAQAGALPRASCTGITLDEVLWDRVLRLPEPSRSLLEVVAVSGRPLRQADAYRAAGLSGEDRTALAVLRTGHLVRSAGPGEQDELETYHDRISESLVAHLSPGQLEARHRQLAVTLEASGHADPETLAVHFQTAGERVKSGRYYALAADRAAAALAFDRAAKLYRLSFQLRPPGGADGRELLMKLGDALANAGRGLEAAREYQAAASGAPAALALELHRRAAMQSLISGHIDEGLAALRTVLDAVGMKLAPTPRRALWSLLRRRAQLRLRGLGFRERDPSQLSAEHLIRIDICWSVAVGLSIVDTIRAADFQTRNLLLALQAGEPYRIARALAWEAAHQANTGGPARRRTAKLIDAANVLARRIDHPHALGLATLSMGIAGYMEGRWKNGREFSEQAEKIFRERCTGVAWELDTAQSFSLWSLFFLGEVAELNRRLPLLLKEARERGDLYAATNLGTFVGHLTWLATDDPEGAASDLRGLMERWSRQGFHVQHLTGLMGQLQIDLYSGDGAAAWQRIMAEWPALAGSLFLRVQVVRIFMVHLRARSALAAAGKQPSLLRAAERDARRLEKENMAWSVPLAQLIRAGVAASRGDRSRAEALLAKAVTGFDAADMGLFAATTRRRHGQLLGGDAGRDLMTRADAWMADQQIKNPSRMTAMHAPGFGD
jgi:serine/threonine protein kinase